MKPGFDPLPYAIPAFIALILIEIAWTRRRAPHAYEPADMRTSLLMGLGSTVFGALTVGAIYAAATWLHQFRAFTIGTQWWVWLGLFVLDDFNYYWAHRTGHRVRWFWAAHVNHHSSQHYNLSTALRQSWTGPVALSFTFRIWPALIGFDPLMLATVGALNTIGQFWFHTEAINRFPRWFEAVMNTPSHHRVHHATNPLYLDRNYAGVFIVWDRLFGSFQREADPNDPAVGPIHYGIVRQLGTYDLLWVAFHEWIGIARDVWSAPWGSKLGYVWRPPGWSHDNSRDSSDMLRTRWLALNQPDATVSD